MKLTTPVQTTDSKARSTTPKPCMFNHFRCTKSGKCVHNSWLCDGEPDCADGEDESKDICDKRTCSPSQFACKNGKCIQSHFKCDSINQCGDNSDEESCGSKFVQSFCHNMFAMNEMYSECHIINVTYIECNI